MAEYDEIVGVRHVSKQAFDVLWLPNNDDPIEIRVDLFERLQLDVAKIAHNRIKTCINEMLDNTILNVPQNLYPLIAKFYRSSEEGTVVELAFITTTASQKHEKMRRKSICLRKEAYHKAGKQALASEIDPYMLSITWNRTYEDDIGSTPKLTLQTRSSNATMSTPTLYDAEFRNCIDIEDYVFIRDKILEYAHT